MTSLRHFTASACVFNDETDAIVLVHHRRLDLWLYPGGHVEDGEAPDETAVREVFEETGIKVALIDQPRPSYPNVQVLVSPWRIFEMATEDPRVGPHHHIDFVYVARAIEPAAGPDGPFLIAEDEVADCRWVPLDQIKDYQTPPELPAVAHNAADWVKRIQGASRAARI